MKKKQVILSGHGPLQNYSTTIVPWEDVWVRYKVRRKLQYEAPCLISKKSLEWDIETDKLALDNMPEHKDMWQESLQKNTAILELLKTQAYVCRDLDSDGGGHIYTSADVLDRKEAERMIRFLLESKGI